MASINVIRRERKNFYKELKKALKAVDTAQEKTERQINRVLSRKSNWPDVEDLKTTAQLSKVVIQKMTAFERLLQKGFID